MIQENQKPSGLRYFVDSVLHHQKSQFSPAFYDLYRARLNKAIRETVWCLSITFVVALLAYLPLWFGYGNVFAASCTVALFIYVLVGTIRGIPDIFLVRVLPYFERRLNGTDTWLAGKDLLWNSRTLDEIAYNLNLTPLSEFLSGDPLIADEMHKTFEASEALTTVEILLRAEATAMLDDRVVSDLIRLRDALALARKNGVRFSLHLRHGATASGYEMDLRHGSYF